jgi:plasmid stabilization system protein ParE
MVRATFTPRANEDLRQIAQYIARDSMPAASNWVRRMRAVCDLLANQPAAGQVVATRHFGAVRRHVVGNYLIYYRSCASGAEILMIVHGARNQDELI